MRDRCYVYMLTNDRNTTLYIGVTSDLQKRMHEHRRGMGSRFTKKYNVYKRVYVMEYQSIKDAIQAEKALKRASRMRKNMLITEQNPTWEDLMIL